MSSYYDNPFISGIQIADASNSPVMWEPEVFDDIYVNPDGIRKDGTRGQTIEPYTEESRNEALFKSLPKGPDSRVIWDMVPTDYHYLKQYEPAPRKIRLPEEEIESEVSSALFDELFKMARGRSVFSNDALDKQKDIRDYLNNDQKVRELLIRQGKIKA